MYIARQSERYTSTAGVVLESEMSESTVWAMLLLLLLPFIIQFPRIVERLGGAEVFNVFERIVRSATIIIIIITLIAAVHAHRNDT